MPHLGDAITQLVYDWHWKEVGDSVNDVVLACKESVESWYSDMLIGSIFPWIIDPPAGWLLLDGSTYVNADYPELSSLLPAHLISGANFTLPDISSAFPFGVQAEADGAAVTGSNDLTLTVGQLPAHTHTFTPPVLSISVGAPPTTLVASVGGPTTTGSTGDGNNIDKRPLRFGLIYAVYAGRE